LRRSCATVAFLAAKFDRFSLDLIGFNWRGGFN
jgi:hypothetical protein